MSHVHFGIIGRLATKVIKLPTSWINILVSSPTDVINTAENTEIFKRLAEGKRGKVDVVDMCIKDSGWNWDFFHAGSGRDDSCAWKEAIVLVKDIFRPKKGVATRPDYTHLLTSEDQQELRDMGVRILLYSETFPA